MTVILTLILLSLISPLANCTGPVCYGKAQGDDQPVFSYQDSFSSSNPQWTLSNTRFTNVCGSHNNDDLVLSFYSSSSRYARLEKITCENCILTSFSMSVFSNSGGDCEDSVSGDELEFWILKDNEKYRQVSEVPLISGTWIFQLSVVNFALVAGDLDTDGSLQLAFIQEITAGSTSSNWLLSEFEISVSGIHTRCNTKGECVGTDDCDCDTWYSGDQCEVCDVNQFCNGANAESCTNTNGEFSCTCTNEWDGETCSIPKCNGFREDDSDPIYEFSDNFRDSGYSNSHWTLDDVTFDSSCGVNSEPRAMKFYYGTSRYARLEPISCTNCVINELHMSVYTRAGGSCDSPSVGSEVEFWILKTSYEKYRKISVLSLSNTQWTHHQIQDFELFPEDVDNNGNLNLAFIQITSSSTVEYLLDDFEIQIYAEYIRCNRRGSCQAPNNCSCEAGFSGTYCQVCDITEFCGGSTNAESCANSNGVVSCTCKNSYAGDSCQFPVCNGRSEEDSNIPIYEYSDDFSDSTASCVHWSLDDVTYDSNCGYNSEPRAMKFYYSTNRYARLEKITCGDNCVINELSVSMYTHSGGSCTPTSSGDEVEFWILKSSYEKHRKISTLPITESWINHQIDNFELLPTDVDANNDLQLAFIQSTDTSTIEFLIDDFEIQVYAESIRCNRHGICGAPNNCSCDVNFSGLDCEICDIGVYCGGTDRSSSCTNSNGLIICGCEVGYDGPSCEFPICFGFIEGDSNPIFEYTDDFSDSTASSLHWALDDVTYDSNCGYNSEPRAMKFYYGTNRYARLEKISCGDNCVINEISMSMYTNSGGSCTPTPVGDEVELWILKNSYEKHRKISTLPLETSWVLWEITNFEILATDIVSGELQIAFIQSTDTSTIEYLIDDFQIDVYAEYIRCNRRGSCGSPNNCSCQSGFYGDQCQQCSLSYCSNSSNSENCENSNGVISCTCKAGFTGSECEYATCNGLRGDNELPFYEYTDDFSDTAFSNEHWALDDVTYASNCGFYSEPRAMKFYYSTNRYARLEQIVACDNCVINKLYMSVNINAGGVGCDVPSVGEEVEFWILGGSGVGYEKIRKISALPLTEFWTFHEVSDFEIGQNDVDDNGNLQLAFVQSASAITEYLIDDFQIQVYAERVVCNRRGLCVSTNNCSCHVGFSGPNCENCDIDTHCNGHASNCLNSNGFISCTCTLGYSGSNCELSVCFGFIEDDDIPILDISDDFSNSEYSDSVWVRSNVIYDSQCGFNSEPRALKFYYSTTRYARLNPVSCDDCVINKLSMSLYTRAGGSCDSPSVGSEVEFWILKGIEKYRKLTTLPLIDSAWTFFQIIDVELFSTDVNSENELQLAFIQVVEDATSEWVIDDFSIQVYAEKIRCNRKGECLAPNNCSCQQGFFGDNCEICDIVEYCGGSLRSIGCSNANGVQTCTCTNEYQGSECQFPVCFGHAEGDDEIPIFQYFDDFSDSEYSDVFWTRSNVLYDDSCGVFSEPRSLKFYSGSNRYARLSDITCAENECVINKLYMSVYSRAGGSCDVPSSDENVEFWIMKNGVEYRKIKTLPLINSWTFHEVTDFQLTESDLDENGVLQLSFIQDATWGTEWLLDDFSLAIYAEQIRCNRRGFCEFPGNCSCETGFFGDNCEKCEVETFCDDEYTANMCFNDNGNTTCLYLVCFGIDDTAKQCSNGRGLCVKNDECECFDGFVGDECEFFQCFGYSGNDSGSCSHHGSCDGINNCSCNENYEGDECELWYCNGVLYNETSVCGGNGSCLSPNNCFCPNYVSEFCENWKCFEVLATENSSCEAHGSCVEPNVCLCFQNWSGSSCKFWEGDTDFDFETVEDTISDSVTETVEDTISESVTETEIERAETIADSVTETEIETSVDSVAVTDTQIESDETVGDTEIDAEQETTGETFDDSFARNETLDRPSETFQDTYSETAILPPQDTLPEEEVAEETIQIVHVDDTESEVPPDETVQLSLFLFWIFFIVRTRLF